MIESNRQNDLYDQEELVAYLDGELEADAVRRVEDRLTTDSKYRGLLQKLERSWELLDELPRSTADEGFTQTTLEMVAVSAAKDVQVQSDSNKMSRSRQKFAVLLLGVIVGGGGYWGFSYWLDRENRQLLQDLPVIERVDMYRTVEDVEFLLMLNEQDLFSGEVDDEV